MGEANERQNAWVSRRTVSITGAAFFAASVAGEVASVALRWNLQPLSDSLEWALYNLSIVGIGVLILRRLPRHPVGWIMCGLGSVSLFATDVLGGYGLRAEAHGWTAAAEAQWLAVASWSTGLLLWILVLLLTPTGGPPGRRWRTWLYVAIAGTGVYVIGWLTSARSTNPDSALSNPFAVSGLPSDHLAALGGWSMGAAMVAAMLSLVLRARGAHPELKQQLKWVALGGVLLVVFVPVGFLMWSTSPLVRAITPLVLAVVVATFAAAVLRYRLFDVDRLAFRAAAYAVATALAIAAYVAGTLGLGSILGGGRSWQVAAATLLAVAIFGPVRGAAQRWIDRRFDREHEARARLDTFLEGLRAGTERADRVEDVLREVAGAPGLELLLRLPASDVFADVHGALRMPNTTRVSSELRTADHVEAIAQYDGPPDPYRSARVVRLLEHARLAVQVARLGVDLNQQLGEVAASRRRISIAADEERRRIQRNLHDGAQQRLVTVGISLRAVEARLRRRSEAHDADVLDVLVADLQATIAELRALVVDLPLPQLDAGIEPAFRELAERAPIQVRVLVDTPRLAPEVEATAYFVGCEALTNTLKHARASAATLQALRSNGSLLVSISDDGIGGATVGNGSGLLSLEDRVAALGGTLRIESADTGTLIEAHLPCV